MESHFQKGCKPKQVGQVCFSELLFLSPCSSSCTLSRNGRRRRQDTQWPLTSSSASFRVTKASEAITVNASPDLVPAASISIPPPLCVDGGLAHPGGWRKVRNDKGSSCLLPRRGAESSTQGRTLHNRSGSLEGIFFSRTMLLSRWPVRPSSSDYRNPPIQMIS